MDCILQKGGASYDEMQGGIWMPGTSDVVLVPGETVPLTDVVMAGDPNLVPENIRLNATIFGVEGTWNKLQAAKNTFLDGINYCTDVTGDYTGFQKKAEGGLTLTSASGNVSWPSGDSVGGSSNNYIDFTGYSTLTFEGVCSLNRTYYYDSSSRTDFYCNVNLNCNLINEAGQSVAGVGIGPPKSGEFSVQMDLANVMGLCKIRISLSRGFGSTGMDTRMQKNPTGNATINKIHGKTKGE